jgi:hypothetical protein
MTRLPELIDSLERSPRQGAAADDPEGARYVVISEAAVNLIIKELRKGLPDRPGAEYFDSGVPESTSSTEPSARWRRGSRCNACEIAWRWN